MDTNATTQALSLFSSRLTTLSALLDKVEAQWSGRDLDELANARLAPDMFSLAQQIWGVCIQPLQFMQWCQGVDQPGPIPQLETWNDARAVLRDALAEISGAAAAGLTAPTDKRITITQIGLYIDFTAQRYLDDWVIPNLYFHLTTAYAILRMKGAEIGKADYLSHLAGDFRPIEAVADA